MIKSLTRGMQQIFTALLLLSFTPCISRADVFVEASQHPVRVSFMVINDSNSQNYSYESTTVYDHGNGLTSTEISSGNGIGSTSRLVSTDDDNPEGYGFFFSQSSGDSAANARYSSSTLYPPYSSSCHNTSSYKPSDGDETRAIFSFESSCLNSNSPFPTWESGTNVVPTPRALWPHNMRPINCSQSRTWNEVHSSPGYSSVYTGNSSSETHATAGIMINGDHTLEYYIEFEVYAIDLESNSTNNPQPIEVRGSNMDGLECTGSKVSGWFSGVKMFYPVAPSVASKCYEFGVRNIVIGSLAKKVQ